MTGFGKATYEDAGMAISVEVKAINAKGLDINLQVPKHLEDQGLLYKHLVQNQLQRGKIELIIDHVDIQLNMQRVSLAIQEPLFHACYRSLENLAKQVGASTETVFQLALQIPGVISHSLSLSTNSINEGSLDELNKTIQQALQNCDASRVQEGEALTISIVGYLAKIKEELIYVSALDGERITSIKEKLVTRLNQLVDKQVLDEVRLEQEMIYYLEKVDFQEEKIRLSSHLAYFDELMQSNTNTPIGKHLSFVAQEIGREINTLGAKANHASIQQHVTIMKSELEKIKEQLQNIL